jgi:hypothetical protein
VLCGDCDPSVLSDSTSMISLGESLFVNVCSGAGTLSSDSESTFC